MALTAKFEADFNAIVEQSKKADAALQGMEKSGIQAEAAIQGVSTAGESWSGWLSKANVLLGTFGIGLSAGAVIGFGKAILDDADALMKLHDQSGISVEGLQAMRIAGDDASVSLDSMTDAVTKLQKRLGGDDPSATSALKDLGIEVEKFKQLDGAQQMSEISDAVRGMHDPLRVANDLSALFGKGWAEQLPALKRGFQELKDGVGQMSTFAVKMFDDLGDAAKRASRTTTAAVGELIATVIDNSLTGGLLALNSSLAEMAATAEKKLKPAFETMVPPGLPTDLDAIVKGLDAMVQSEIEHEKAIKAVQKVEGEVYRGETDNLLGLSKATEASQKQRFEAEMDGLKAIAKAHDDTNDFIAKQSLDSASYQILQVWRAADEKVRAFKGTADQVAAFTTAVMDLAAREANAVVYEADKALTTVTEKAVGAARAVQLAIQQVDAGQAVDVVANRAAAGVTGIGMQAPIYVAPPIFARAAGGPVSSGQSYLVGERGPELFTPAGNGAIAPNGMGLTQNIVIYVNGTAMDVARQVSDEIMRVVMRGQQFGA